MSRDKLFHGLIAFALGVAAAIILSPAVKADWTILHYDKDGNPIVERGGIPKDGAPPRAPDSTPARQAPSSPPREPGQRFVAGEVLVADPPRGFARIAAQMGFVVLDRVALENLSISVFRLRIPKGSTVPAALRQLRRRFPGVGIDANHLLDPSGATASPVQQARLVLKWHDAPEGCGGNVRLGMIDGAVDLAHPALTGQRIEYRSFHNQAFTPARQDHGTAIAAMLVGRDRWGGLLPAAELKAANIFEESATGQVSANTFGLLRAVDWLTGERVHVINLSVAGAKNKILDKVLTAARQRDATLVAAAGNGGRAAEPAYPAAYSYVLAVTAVGPRRSVYAHANRGHYVDFAAPGVGIWTAVPGGGKTQSGTSFATPYLTVLVGLEIARGGRSNPDSLRQLLRRHAVDLGAVGKDEIYGWGLVEMQRNCQR